MQKFAAQDYNFFQILYTSHVIEESQIDFLMGLLYKQTNRTDECVSDYLLPEFVLFLLQTVFNLDRMTAIQRMKDQTEKLCMEQNEILNDIEL